MSVSRLRFVDTTTRLAPGLECPACGKHNDATSGEGKPKPGDFSLCAYCAAVARFDETLKLRALTVTEALEAACDPELLRVQDIVRRAAAARRK